MGEPDAVGGGARRGARADDLDLDLWVQTHPTRNYDPAWSADRPEGTRARLRRLGRRNVRWGLLLGQPITLED